MAKCGLPKIHERWVGPKALDFFKNLRSSRYLNFSYLCSGKKPKQRAQKRRRIIISDSSEGDSDPDSLDSSDPDDRADSPGPDAERQAYKIPKIGKRIWDNAQIENLKKNFRNLENLDSSILGCLSFKEIAAMGNKRDRAGKILTEKLAETFERVKTFPEKVEAGEDHCTGLAHKARFLRGYVGNSQNLWTQARVVLGLAGLDAISNYETVSVGLNGYVGSRVWHEVHSPSSKQLSIRMLTASAMKTAWNTSEKGGGNEKI